MDSAFNMDPLLCSACGNYYNWTDRRPKALDCGHAMCLKDIQDLGRSGQPVKCPKDQTASNKRIEEYRDDHALVEMLDMAEVRCVAHSSIAASFCLEHCLALCQDCRHPGCRVKELPGDLDEILYTVRARLEDMSKRSTPSPALRGKLDKRAKMLLRDLMNVYKELADLASPVAACPPPPQQRPILPNQPITCETCKGPANGALRFNDYKAYCQSHASKNVTEGTACVKLDGSVSEQDLCSQLLARFPTLLSKVNFYDLDLQTLRTVAALPPSPSALRDLSLQLIRKACVEKGSLSQAPDEFYCPSCLQPLRRETAAMRELRCGKALHAVCESCVRTKGDVRAVCPLDKGTFGDNYTQLRFIGVPAVPTPPPAAGGVPPELAALQGARSLIQPDLGRSSVPIGLPGQLPVGLSGQLPTSALPTQLLLPKGGPPQPFSGLPTQFNPSSSLGLPAQVPGLPAQVPKPGLSTQIPKLGPPTVQPGLSVQIAQPGPPIVQPKPGVQPTYVPVPSPPQPRPVAMPDIPKVSGTPLPPANLRPGELALDRFPSVLPPIDIPIDRRSANQRGWYQTQGKNQVEAMVFGTSENLLLLGVSIAAPLSPAQASIVDFVNIYRNRDTRVAPAYSHRGRERIQGGNQLLGDVRFAQPFPVQGSQQYCLKIKLSGDPAASYETYRGNPFERPDLWFTEDGVLWEFEECTQVEPTEYVNGQNNLSGPILRLFYRRS